jgi:hypothetical protein
MTIKGEAIPGEVVVSPDPLARAKRVSRKGRPYAAALVVVLAVVGSVFRHYLSWGDFPTWIMAVTTLLAFLAAAFAGLVAYDLLQIEAGRDLKAAEERTRTDAERREAAKERDAARRAADVERAAQRDAARRAQASKVTAWFAQYDPVAAGYPGSPSLESNLVTWGGAVRNASDLPVFDVRIFYFRVNDRRDGSPWTADQVYASADIIRVIPPGQTRNEELPQRVREQYQGCNDQLYVVSVEFTDADGARWYRNERAALEPR